MSVPPEEPDPEFPFTLDLRRPEPVAVPRRRRSDEPAPAGRVSAGVVE